MRRNFLAASLILGSGLIIVASVFAVSAVNRADSANAASSSKWTQPLINGTVVPACGSASVGGTCSGGAGAVAFSWNAPGYNSQHGDLCLVINPNPFAGIVCNLPESGSYTYTGLPSNASYEYAIGDMASGNVTTPNCSVTSPGGTTSGDTTPGGTTPPGGGSSGGGSGGRGGGSGGGGGGGGTPQPPPTCQDSSATNFGGPLPCNYVPPTVSIFANNTSGTIFLSAPANYIITWNTTNAASCTAFGSWSGAKPSSGSQIFSNVGVGIYSYGLFCTNPGGSASSVVVVKVSTIHETTP